MLDVKPAPRTATPPAKHWRNYYRVYRVLRLYRLGTIFPGIHAGPDAFSSQEEAEHYAQNFVKAANPQGRFIIDFAGAYPEGVAH
jgi:hypothetical protein